MPHAIAWIFERLLRLLLPPSGRHRAANSVNGRPTVRQRDEPLTRPVRVRHAPVVSAWAQYMNTCAGGDVVAMVRPCLLVHERRREQREREQRAECRLRRQRRIHGARVAA